MCCHESEQHEGGGQGSLRLVNWAKEAEKVAPGTSPEEGEVKAGGRESGLSHTAMPEDAGDWRLLFSQADGAHFFNSDCPFSNKKMGTSTSVQHSPRVCVVAT